MNVQTLFDISNIFFLIGTLMLCRAVLKNRVMLKGFSSIGSLLTFSAMMFVNVAYVFMGFWMSLGIASVTTAYWFIVFIYSTKIFITRYREQKLWSHRLDKK